MVGEGQKDMRLVIQHWTLAGGHGELFRGSGVWMRAEFEPAFTNCLKGCAEERRGFFPFPSSPLSAGSSVVLLICASFWTGGYQHVARHAANSAPKRKPKKFLMLGWHKPNFPPLFTCGPYIKCVFLLFFFFPLATSSKMASLKT